MDVRAIDDLSDRCWILSMVTGSLLQTATPLLVYRDESAAQQTLDVLSRQRIQGIAKFTLHEARLCGKLGGDDLAEQIVFLQRAIVVAGAEEEET